MTHVLKCILQQELVMLNMKNDLLKTYQLFLFDFDGLLVNTEEIHYKAYSLMMKNRGVDLTWSFERYCQAAHYDSTTFRKEILEEFPALLKSGGIPENDPWLVLYHEKQQKMQELLKLGAVQLMPGVSDFLSLLQKDKIPHSVVTHSPDELVKILRQRHPILDKIPYWVTRHDYKNPKPDSECYKLAIKRYKKEGDAVVGFEDTPRGLEALMGTEATPILVTKIPYPEINQFKAQGVTVIESFLELL